MKGAVKPERRRASGSRIADAALAAGLDGDLKPAAVWLRLIGATVTVEHGTLRWQGAPGVPVGGIVAPSDPCTCCIQLLLATAGVAAFPAGGAVLREVERRWKRHAVR